MRATRRNIGEIIQRGRFFYIRYYDLRGRRRLESTHSDDRTDAEKLLRKRLSAKDGGVLPEAAIGSLTLKEATDDLIADYKTNKRKSLRDVQGKITMHLLPFFGERCRMVSSGRPRSGASSPNVRARAPSRPRSIANSRHCAGRSIWPCKPAV